MNELQRIQSVLIAVRRRALLRAALQTAGFGLAAMLAALLLLALSATAVGPAGFWPLLSVVVLAALGVGALALGLDKTGAGAARGDPRGRPPGRAAAADGRQRPVLRGRARAARRHARRDRLRNGVGLAHAGARAARLGRHRGRAAGSAAFILAASRGVGAGRVGGGRGGHRFRAATLAGSDPRHRHAGPSAHPLRGCGDLAGAAGRRSAHLSYEYPAYTGLPPRIVDGSTGDILAVKGTKVRLGGAAVAALAQGAACSWAKTASAASCPPKTEVKGGAAPTELTLNEERDVSASGWHQSWSRPVRELRSHQMTAEVDNPPRVEIPGATSGSGWSWRRRSRSRSATPPTTTTAWTGSSWKSHRIGDQPGAAPAAERCARRARRAGACMVRDPAVGGHAAGRRAHRLSRVEAKGSRRGVGREGRIVARTALRGDPESAREHRVSGSIGSASCSGGSSRILANRLAQAPAAHDGGAPAGDMQSRLATIGALHEAE